MTQEITYLDPTVLASISNLELRARFAVEGFINGLHRSPFRGFSVEFSEYRHYHPGDDIRHIDWKLFDVVFTRTRKQLPVDVSNIITGMIMTVLGKFDAKPPKGTPVKSIDEPFAPDAFSQKTPGSSRIGAGSKLGVNCLKTCAVAATACSISWIETASAWRPFASERAAT